MDVLAADKGVFCFGPFRVDPVRRSLTRAGTPIKLTAKQLDTLLYFVANPNRIIEKDELLAAVWPGRIVEEGNLTQTISLLRRALQADESERYIVTASGRGYRFAIEVHRDAGAPFAQPETPAAQPALISGGDTQTNLSRSTILTLFVRGRSTIWRATRRVRVFGAATIIIATIAATIYGAGRWLHPAGDPSGQLAHAPQAALSQPFAPPPHSVAILAFTNLSGDPTQEYFSDGLSEELINALSRVGTVQVAARTSAFSFKGGSATVGDIAHRLNVGAIVEGSVRRDGQLLRINVQLINAVTGFEVWSRSYDRDITGVLALQSDIAAAIVDSLKVTLLADAAARLIAGGTSNAAAFEAYLRGARLMQTLSSASAHAALAGFDEAIHFDPLYANAYAGRAAALMEMATYWDDDHDQDKSNTDAALVAADRAVALAPASPYAHTVRGDALRRKADFAQAAEEQTIAHRLGPEDAEATRGYAIMQCMLGHKAEADAASRHMIELDPLRPSLYHYRAMIQGMDGDYDGALETYRQELALGDGDLPVVRAYTAWTHLDQNRPQLAEQDCKPGCAWPEFDNAIIAYKLGRVADAQASLDKLHLVHQKRKESPFSDDAEIYAVWGESAKALEALGKAVRTDPFNGRWLRVDPSLSPIRNTPEFRQIEASLHLPP